jgi:hypothetical protein
MWSAATTSTRAAVLQAYDSRGQQMEDEEHSAAAAQAAAPAATAAPAASAASHRPVEPAAAVDSSRRQHCSLLGRQHHRRLQRARHRLQLGGAVFTRGIVHMPATCPEAAEKVVYGSMHSGRVPRAPWDIERDAGGGEVRVWLAYGHCMCAPAGCMHSPNMVGCWTGVGV